MVDPQNEAFFLVTNLAAIRKKCEDVRKDINNTSCAWTGLTQTCHYCVTCQSVHTYQLIDSKVSNTRYRYEFVV